MASFLDTWLDGLEDGWGIPVLLAIFLLLWTVFFGLAYPNGDLHPDVLEAWTIGRTPDWGGAKHPPLMGWITHVWTLLFPARDWSLYLLAMTNSAVALWMIDLTTRRFARGDKRVIVLLLLMLLPVYQFQAQRFNANSVLFAVWPLAVYCFLRSFETRHAGWAIAAGLAGALAVLGKYYSAFLILGFVFAAVCHPARRAYFTSSTPWISTAAGLLLLAPHIQWIVSSGTNPLQYALATHGGISTVQAFLSGLTFLLGLTANLALPGLVWIVMIRSRAGDYFRSLTPLQPDLLLLLLVGIGAVIIPPLVALVLGNSVTAIWAAPGLYAFVVVAVCIAKFPIDRAETRRLAVGVLAFTIIAVLLAPAHAFYRNSHPFGEGRNYYSLASAELMKRWRQITSAPLKTVSGDKLAMALGFYSPDHPAFVIPFNQQYVWQMPSRAELDGGWATMCLPDEETCLIWLKQVEAIAPEAVRFDFVVQPRFWDFPGTPTHVAALVVLPRVPR